MATVHEHPPQPPPEHFMATSGAKDPVWVHTEPFSSRPTFPQLEKNIHADVCIIGSGIAGISCAYELVMRGNNVVMLEARDVISGETSRTSGHLANALDDGYVNIEKKHGPRGAIYAAESHTWAIERVGEIAKKLGIECEYRKIPAYQFSQYDRDKQPREHAAEVSDLKQEVEKARSVGVDAEFKPGFAIRGWDGKPDQRDVAIFRGQAAFHPTKYLVGVLEWLNQQPNFKCFTHTRVMDISEKGIEIGQQIIGRKTVAVTTDTGFSVNCGDAIMATCVPLHKLSLIAEMEYNRTYCVAIKIPKGTVEDALMYDTAEQYKYVRLTECDAENDYMIVGGCDHKVGQEEPTGRFAELETWTRERFTKAGSMDYAWSGQVFEPVDYVAFIGRDPGTKHTYVVTGDSGNGLTHGVLASSILADDIGGKPNAWGEIYAPQRKSSLLKSAREMLGHDLQINSQYKRFLKSDIRDIEDLPKGEGGVLNPTAKSPIAVYKDDNGGVHELSAICPHMKGVVSWNRTEKSWDCPVHGSRFSKDGMCVVGPAKGNLEPLDDRSTGLRRDSARA